MSETERGTESGQEDVELEKMERQMEFQEKQMEMANELLKDAPGLLSELITECILPVAVQLQAGQDQVANSGRRGKPTFEPQVDKGEIQGPSEESVEKVRENLGLDSDVDGGDSVDTDG